MRNAFLIFFSYTILILILGINSGIGFIPEIRFNLKLIESGLSLGILLNISFQFV